MEVLSSVESNVSISVPRTSGFLDRSSSVFNTQKYCNLFFSGSFNIRISQNGTLLHSILKNYIFFQSSRTILLLYTSKISVFSNNLCVFATLSIIVLNFSTSEVQKTFYDNILLKCEKILNISALTFFILVIWQFDTFFICMSYTLIFIMF